MTWADLMNIDPVRVGLGGLVLIILAAFGIRPIKAFSARAVKRNEAEAEEALADTADAAARIKAIRRDDNEADRWYHLAKRAYLERDEAYAERDQANKERHKAVNGVQATLARMELDCSHAIKAIEVKAAAALRELTTKLEQRDLDYAKLLTKYEECMKRNEELNAKLNRRMDAAGFDPTKTEE